MVAAVTKQIEQFVQELGDERSYELFTKVPSGKMLRTKLILQIAKTPEAVRLAAIVEMIHAASLLHDDVIDEATKRRGVDSINAIFGNKSAIMLGDILYSKAFYELTKFSSQIAQTISHAVALLSLGELKDVELSNSFNSNEESYFDMIYKKTASLIEASAKSAAILAGLDSEAYGLYGKNLGLAFQIVDDILDITQNEQTLGKPALADFAEGKTTLPYIYLYQSLGEDDRQKLLYLFKKELNPEQKAWLFDKFEETGAIQRAKEQARALGHEALEQLHKSDEKLRQIMEELIERTY
ncbi:polyprenyl synthetase family protein [Nitratiruptor sp. YY09-18]|uniref:polyprenyl synthetase family protein n=1 Tax=Nitratiruptor sp. YY09-18 TaxID=2724901 RepID=UPI001915D2C5|nr:polyprenyl synthetase family protein [Nitratiruptor sp. YY09-18]BCD68227.1 octaprenyl-diphosphate synthase [Nitratiruptor sp. YY09-18]